MTDTQERLGASAAQAARPTARGVVNCAIYRDGQRREIPVEQCGVAVRNDEGILWLGLFEPEEELLCLIQSQLGLHELLIEDVHQAHQRPKLEFYGDVLFIVVRTAQLVEGQIAFGETHLIVSKGFVVSIRHGASASYAEVRRRCERSPQLLRLGECFIAYAILDFIADNYYPIVDAVTDELEAIESKLFSGAPAIEKIERIYRLRASLVGMRRAVSPMVEVTNRLARHELPVKVMAIEPYLHDLHDHVTQVDEAVVDLRERLASAFEASLLLGSAAQNEIVKKLAAWAAILAVPTAIAGIYGMNFKVMPELEWQFGYPGIMILMAGLCGYLFYRFKRAGWL